MESSTKDISKIDLPGTSKNNVFDQEVIQEESVKADEDIEDKFFECSKCNLRERYEYFGKEPPFVKHYIFKEDAYVIVDPFLPPKQNEYLILGAHCIKCNSSVCKDSNCSFYFDGTFCINCALKCIQTFPKVVQDKLTKIST